MSRVVVVPPIVGAFVLVVGTGAAVGISAKTRQRERLKKLPRNLDDMVDLTPIDDEELGAASEVPCEEHSDAGANNKEPNGASSSAYSCKNDNQDAPAAEDSPLWLPTVSVATCDFGSRTYLIFVCTAVLHAACLVPTAVLQLDAARTSDTVPPDDANYAKTLGVLLVSVAAVGAAAIVLTSLVPARGRGTCPHKAFGAVFFECALLWMVWTCMLTPLLGMGTTLLAVRAVLASVACASMLFCAKRMMMLGKLRGREGCETEWLRGIHLVAIGQMTFGLAYAVFLVTVAIDLAT